MVNEVAYDLINALPQNFPVGQDTFDCSHHPPQPFGSLSMFSFKVADACRRGGITRFQFFEDHVLFGMVSAIRIILKVLDDGLYDVIIWPLRAIKDAQLPLENQEQFFDVAVLLTQNIEDFRHRLMPSGNLPVEKMAAAHLGPSHTEWALSWKTSHMLCLIPAQSFAIDQIGDEPHDREEYPYPASSKGRRG
jgi:hypothetical protein